MELKQFDHPYLTTLGVDSVRYQILPAYLHGHWGHLVYHYICVNPTEPKLQIWSGHFHCKDCGLMGTMNTLKNYRCSEPDYIAWEDKKWVLKHR